MSFIATSAVAEAGKRVIPDVQASGMLPTQLTVKADRRRDFLKFDEK